VSLLLAAVSPAVFGATLLEQGEDALRQNQPDRAQALLQAAVSQDSTNEQAFLFLGVADLQLGKLSDALTVLKQGLSVASQYADSMYFNIGNIYFMQGQNTLAEGMYGKAIQANPNMADAYLNRANARMRLQSYDGAVQDYTVYLTLKPDAPQQATIQQLIALLNQKKAEIAQQQQLADQQKQAEEARQKALLNDVMQSLGNASNETKNLQAGTAPIQDSKATLGLDD
jgi:tetratricopeptide (TPR) repeat protein